MSRLFCNCDGSVLMEYVIVCSLIGVGIVVLFHMGFFNFGDGFIGLGRELQTAMQRKLGGIALPIP